LETGDLGLTHIQIAIRTSIRNRKDIPDGIKDILCGKGESSAGFIFKTFNIMREMIGSLELAYLRGKQEGDEK
jgi:hypothetical protein